jgi:hypothetical protein
MPISDAGLRWRQRALALGELMIRPNRGLIKIQKPIRLMMLNSTCSERGTARSPASKREGLKRVKHNESL